MGSETSKNYSENSLISNNIDSFDIDGIKTTEESSLDENQKNKFLEDQTFSDEKDTNTINENSSNNKVPVTFEWDKGGNSVYVTGNFCNWDQFFLMEKNEEGKFFLILYLAKGLIQYKFKVDNQWKCNDKFPIMKDNGHDNNYIDTTNWEISAEESEEEKNTNVNSITELSTKPKTNKSFMGNNHYSTYIPQGNEMNNFAPKIPDQYKQKIYYSKISRQNKIGNSRFLCPEEDDLFGENYSYKKIKNFRHEEINHISYKLKNITSKPSISSIVSRYRLKFTSFVYYK